MKMKGAGTMNITDVRVRKVAKEGKMKAVVSITIDEEFVVHDIKVIEGEKGLFIAMPSRKAKDGEYRDIAHPINSRTRDRIQTLILEKYQEMLDAEPEVPSTTSDTYNVPSLTPGAPVTSSVYGNVICLQSTMIEDCVSPFTS